MGAHRSADISDKHHSPSNHLERATHSDEFSSSCLCGGIFFEGTYIHFKYLALASPIISTTFVFILQRQSSLWLSLLGTGIGIIYIGFCSFGTLRSYHVGSILNEKQWNDLRVVARRSIRPFETLVLSHDEWFSYFIDGDRDSAPMTQYVHQPLSTKPFDMIDTDEKYAQEIDAFLRSHPTIQAEIQSSPCKKKILDRFTLIDLRCRRSL